MKRQDKSKPNDSGMSENKLRIAIVSTDKCKPKKCRQECKRTCPVTKTGNKFYYFNRFNLFKLFLIF